MTSRHAPTKNLGLTALLGAASFTSSLIVLQVARSDIDWTRHYVSDFANGSLGWVFVLGVLVHGFGNLALSLGLRRSLDPGPLRTGAVVLLAVAVAGIVGAALFPIDSAFSSPTRAGLAHRAFVGVSFPLELAALLLFSAAFTRHARWRPYSRTSFVLSAISAVALTGLLLAVLLNQLPGLAERLALASFLAWEFWAAFHLAGPLLD